MNKHNKGFSTLLSILILILAIGGIVLLATNKNNPKNQENSMIAGDAMTQDDSAMKGDENSMMKDDGDSMMASDVMAKGGYEDYASEKLAFATTGHIVLFFYAPWCPTCRSADADITGKLETIPTDLLILKTDYDTSTDLKKKYGVTYQHTFVEVDANGAMVQKWSGGDLSTILSHTQ